VPTPRPAVEPPSWLGLLNPIRKPKLELLSRHSEQLVWHVDIELQAWLVPPGRLLSGSDTWNGKALVVPSNRSIERSVGEVEVAERLRVGLAGCHCFWTAGRGNPPKDWRPWALTHEPRAKHGWLLTLDRQLRAADPVLDANAKGWPDVVFWQTGLDDLHCIEYKGPRPSAPTTMDTVSQEQDAWCRAAFRLGKMTSERYAVARWVPSPAACEILSRQAHARIAPNAKI
jgi:hypothetical protein